MTAPETSDAPRWTRAVDAAALAFGILFFFVLLFGGFVVHLGAVPLRVRSPERLLFIAVALVAVRHAVRPVDPLHRRLARAFRAREEESAASIVPAAIATRAAVLLIGYLAVVTVGVASTSVGFTVSPDRMSNLPARFDAGWYGGIAADGYYFEGRFDRQQNVAFFPAFPMLERAVGYPLGAFRLTLPPEMRMARLLWAGVIVSLAAFAWAAVYLWRLAQDTIGLSRATAAVALLASYPFAVFFSAPYTESLFLLGSVAAIYHFRRQQFAAAAVWGLLVGLTRPNGCFLSVVLAAFVAQWAWDRARLARRGESAGGRLPDYPIVKALLAASAPGIGMLLFSAYVHHLTGDFFGWARLHEAWGRSYEGLAPVGRGYTWIANEGLVRVVEGLPYDTMNCLGLMFALAMLWPVTRRLGLPFALFILLNVGPPMVAGGVLSMGRLTATLFPVFLALAAVVRPRAITPLVTGFAIGQGLVAVLFFTWRPMF